MSHLTSGDIISNSKADNYKRCYGKNQLKFGSKPVLIVIDCVKAYHDPKPPLYALERFDIALKSIMRLIEKCRAVGIPVVYTSVIYETPNAGESGTRRSFQTSCVAMMLETRSESLPKESSRERMKWWY